MKYLETQEQLEILLRRAEPAPGEVVPHFSVIWFSATWCGPCRRVQSDALEKMFPQVNWLKCDVDLNNYSPGYCGVRAIPAFMAITDGKPSELLQSSSTEAIADWVQEKLNAAQK
jgi:thioredoxin-like negative regulator of GroEL